MNEYSKLKEFLNGFGGKGGMPVRISGLGIDATDDVCRMLAEKASLNGAKTLGNFRILETEDMYRTFRAAAK